VRLSSRSTDADRVDRAFIASRSEMTSRPCRAALRREPARQIASSNLQQAPVSRLPVTLSGCYRPRLKKNSRGNRRHSLPEGETHEALRQAIHLDPFHQAASC
jgi:hypothetical protein